MNTLKFTAASLALVAALAAAGCGGGGGNQQYSGMTPTAPAPTPAPTPPPPPPTAESFNLWLSGVIGKPADGGAPVEMDTKTFVLDTYTNAYDSLFVGLQ